MPRVKLEGLNIRRNRKSGKWYVSIRATGKALVRGYSGTKDQLLAHLATDDVLALYASLKRSAGPRTHREGTLGALVEWFQADPHSKWNTKLADRTKADYRKVIDWLEKSNADTYLAADLETADIVEIQERAAAERYVRFGDMVVSFLSALFRRAVQKAKYDIKVNPALGIDRVYKASAGANRNWQPREWEWVSKNAPPCLVEPLFVMRYAGLRGIDAYSLKRSNYIEIADAGKALSFRASKNGKVVTVFVVPELEAVLDRACADLHPNAEICRNSLGNKVTSVNALRKDWHEFKTSATFKEALPESGDLTLHGLRVTYAGEIKELGFSDQDVAGAIGDNSPSMGKHYSRHADPLKAARRVYEARTKNA